MASAKAKESPAASIEDQPRPVVFYDGGCPLCRKEIDHYRRLDRTHSLTWLDISREPLRVGSYGLSIEQAMRRFHVLDSQGRWQTGVMGFVELWSQLPYYRWLASTVKLLRLHRPLEPVYRRWADWRLRRRCSDEQCGLSRD